MIDLVAIFIPRSSHLYWEEPVPSGNAANQDTDVLKSGSDQVEHF